jgi:hypothetical protein
MPIRQPSESRAPYWLAREHVGELHLFQVVKFHEEYQSEFGNKPMAEAIVVVFDKENQPTRYEDAQVFGNLTETLRDAEGVWTGGRLAQGPQKPGRKPPFILLDLTLDEMKILDDYIEEVGE